MVLPNVSFTPVDDIHLLRGQSLSLVDLLTVGEQNATDFQSENEDVEYTFTPCFKNISGTAEYSEGFGVRVRASAGFILTDSTIPAIELKNFLVTARVKLGDESRDTAVRIHIHNSIVEAWLSPSILTVQSGIDGFRFSVRVKYDDDVVAEIGQRTNEITPVTDLFNVRWFHTTPGLIDLTSGIIKASVLVETGMLSGNVEATISDPLSDLSIKATGQINVQNQLSETQGDIIAQLVATGNCPGFSKANQVPNILFIPDGFTDADDDSGSFTRIVDDYIHDLMSGKITSPFGMLTGSINFWKIFIPSREKGVTTRSEVYLTEDDGKVYGIPFDLPEKPMGDDSSKWSLPNLFYHFGLPVREYKSRSLSFIRDHWALTSLLPYDQIDAIPDNTVEQWKNSCERRLPDERDTVLGLYVNDYSAASNDDDFDSIDFNSPKRLERAMLNPFLSNLKDDEGNGVGKYFLRGTGFLAGKDFDNIVFVSAATKARVNNFKGGLFMSLKEWTDMYEMDQDALANIRTSVKYDNNIPSFSLLKKATLTHELGHSFALEDEYGEAPPSDSYKNKFINNHVVSGWKYTQFDGDADDMDWSGNVQAGKDLISLNPNAPGTTFLDAKKIKWRYHRIVKCGTVAGSLDPPDVDAEDDNIYSVPLSAGHVKIFSEGDKVFLRKRTQYTYEVSADPSGTGIYVADLQPDLLISNKGSVSEITEAGILTIKDALDSLFVVTLEDPDLSADFQVGDELFIHRDFGGLSPVYSFRRLETEIPDTDITLNTIVPNISQELEISEVKITEDRLLVKTTDGTLLDDEFVNLRAGQKMILYKPMDAPDSVETENYKYAEIISKKVLDHLTDHPFAFNAKPDENNDNAITEIIDRNFEQQTSIPNSLVPCCSRNEKKIVGLYSCGNQYHGNIYHPTGKCFMRKQYHDDGYDEFCIVCKYILIDMIDPVKHGKLNNQYPDKIYPT